MRQQERVAKLIDWFVRAAHRHAEAVEAMQEEAAGVQVECLGRFFAALHREEGGMPAFFTLLDHEDPAVAGMAAVYGLAEADKCCRPALVRVAQGPGLIGFRAQIAVERWDRGEWSGS